MDPIQILRQANYQAWKDLRDSTTAASIRLDGADLSWTRLSGFDLSDLDFSNTSFDFAKIDGCSFARCNLSRASLTEADASGATFSECNINGAVLSGCKLFGSDLSSVRGLTVAQLEAAQFDDTTDLPFEYDHYGYDEDDEDYEDQLDSHPVLPDSVPAPIQTTWSDQYLIAEDFHGNSDIFASTIPQLTRALKESIDRCAEELKGSNVDQRLTALVVELGELISSEGDMGDKLFRVAFLADTISEFFHRISDELSESAKSHLTSTGYNTRGLLIQFKEFRDYSQNVDLARMSTSLQNPDHYHKMIDQLRQFHVALDRRPDVFQKKIPDTIISDIESIIETENEYAILPKERIFGALSNAANVIWSLLKPFAANVGRTAADGARDGFQETTKEATKWVLRAAGGGLVWVILQISGSFEWLAKAWALVKAIL